MARPVFSMPDKARKHCFDWARHLMAQPGNRDGTVEQAAMGRFGELCVMTHLKMLDLNVVEGPKYKHDFVVQSPKYGGQRRIEVKTKVEKHRPSLRFHVLVRLDQYCRQQNDSDIYVFVSCYPDSVNGYMVGEIVGFELAENISRWQLLMEGDRLESGWECRFSSFRTTIDALKPIDALPEYWWYVNEQQRIDVFNKVEASDDFDDFHD